MGIALLLGAIALAVAFSSEEEGEDEVPSEPKQREKTAPEVPKSPPADEQPQADSFQWTLASIVLDKKPDPYNPADIAERVKRNRLRAANTDDAQLVADIQTVELAVIDYFTSGYGSKLWSLLQKIGKAIVGESHGGFDALRPLSRKMILFCLPGSLAEMSLTAIPQPPKSSDAAEWTAYFRKVLITYRIAMEFSRLVEVDDQLLPPAPVLGYLVERKLWPPPVEPAPPLSGSVFAQYSGLGRWAQQWVQYNPIESLLYPSGAALPQNPQQLAMDVYMQLSREFSEQTTELSRVMSLCKVPLQLAGNLTGEGSYPRIGSSAAPITVKPGDVTF